MSWDGDGLQDYSMLELFRMEAMEQLGKLNQGLLELEKGRDDETTETLMRAAHSLKGAARMVGVGAIVKLAHALEDCLVAVQGKRLNLGREVMDSLLAAVDAMASVVTRDDEEMLAWERRHPQETEQMLDRLARLLANSPASARDGDEVSEAWTTPAEGTTTRPGSVRISSERLERMVVLAGEALVESQRLNGLRGGLWGLKRRQRDVLDGLEQLSRRVESGQGAVESAQRWRTLVGAMIEMRQGLSDLLMELESQEHRMVSVCERLHREVQVSRMRPFKEITRGLPRFVRDLARRLGKEVNLRMSGLGTLVDRQVLESIEIPLRHLIQNAIDHGLESADERQGLGKNPSGQLSINVKQVGGMLSLIVADDGRGIDLPRLKEKLLAQGLVTPSELEERADQELLQYVFSAGFSTRDEISEISGRGVGLDVVRDSLQVMGGRIRLRNDTGKGLEFQLMMPLSVSLMRLLLVSIGGETYGLPLARLGQVLKIAPSQIEKVDGRQVIYLENERLPLVHANSLLGYRYQAVDGEDIPLVVLGREQRQVALVVEALVNEKAMVIEGLPFQLGRVEGVHAVSQDEEGRMVLVLDIDELRDMALRRQPAPSPAVVGADGASILVVDDSLTVREVQRKLLSEQGYQVKLAENGRQAAQLLEERRFDLVISDIDMPEWTGLQLLDWLRQQPALTRLPVLLMSHRDDLQEQLEARFDPLTRGLGKKDYSAERFLRAVKRQLEQGRKNEAS